MHDNSDEYFMREALREAGKAADEGEIPVGAIIVAGGSIIARAHNQTERLNDVTAHAEMVAITAAADYLGAKYLNDCTLYATLEPCVMCAGAIGWSQLGRIVYGAADPKRGFTKRTPSPLHPKTEVASSILADECSALVKDFFKKKR
jgi:tRNA(adenine34) deaminase